MKRGAEVIAVSFREAGGAHAAVSALERLLPTTTLPNGAHVQMTQSGNQLHSLGETL